MKSGTEKVTGGTITVSHYTRKMGLSHEMIMASAKKMHS